MIELKTTMLIGAVTLNLFAYSLGCAEEDWDAFAEGLVKSTEAQSAQASQARADFIKNLRAAQQGDGEAQYQVGLDFWNGRVVDKDEPAAFKWFLKSAQQNYTLAQERVARAYSEGRGVAQDPGQAFHWYRRAAANGSKDAMMSLAHMYMDGKVVAQDLDKAKSLFLQLANSESILYRIRASVSLLQLHEAHYPEDTAAILHWMEKAYEVGNGHLRSRLIKAYTDGELVPPDDKKAFRYLSDYSRAPATPDEEFLLAVMYEEGRGTKKNKKKAEEIFERLIRFGHPDALIHQKVREKEPKAKRGDAQAQYEIAQAYLSKEKLSKRDADEVISWLEKASKKKHREARMALAFFYGDERAGQHYDKDKGVAILETMAAEGDAELQIMLFQAYQGHDDAIALRWLKAAADQGHYLGQYHLAKAYFHGTLGLAQDMERAADLFYASAEQGLLNAMYEMGQRYQHGHGLDADLEKALEWYEAAAEHNYAPAVQKVAELKASR